MQTKNQTITRTLLKSKSAVTLTTLAAAVALPQLVHICARLSGAGASLGEMLLPMHLPIILAGLIAGPYVGMAAGALAPLLSFALTNMPSSLVLPFMCIELAGYGLIAGLLSKKDIPTLVKILVAQAGGRLVRLLAMISAPVLDLEANVIGYISSMSYGLVGISLQLVSITLVIYALKKKKII